MVALESLALLAEQPLGWQGDGLGELTGVLEAEGDADSAAAAQARTLTSLHAPDGARGEARDQAGAAFIQAVGTAVTERIPPKERRKVRANGDPARQPKILGRRANGSICDWREMGLTSTH